MRAGSLELSPSGQSFAVFTRPVGDRLHALAGKLFMAFLEETFKSLHYRQAAALDWRIDILSGRLDITNKSNGFQERILRNLFVMYF